MFIKCQSQSSYLAWSIIWCDSSTHQLDFPQHSEWLCVLGFIWLHLVPCFPASMACWHSLCLQFSKLTRITTLFVYTWICHNFFMFEWIWIPVQVHGILAEILCYWRLLKQLLAISQRAKSWGFCEKSPGMVDVGRGNSRVNLGCKWNENPRRNSREIFISGLK